MRLQTREVNIKTGNWNACSIRMLSIWVCRGWCLPILALVDFYLILHFLDLEFKFTKIHNLNQPSRMELFYKGVIIQPLLILLFLGAAS
jgi:hypothetical protein